MPDQGKSKLWYRVIRHINVLADSRLHSISNFLELLVVVEYHAVIRSPASDFSI